MRIVLASGSPRRKELLAKITPSFEIIPSTAPEFSSATTPQQYVQELAMQKAVDVRNTHGLADAVVIGCDTVVDLDGNIMGKPKDAAEATEMLQALSGKTHYVHTGVCILHKLDACRFCESTAVVFRKLSQKEIDDYVLSGAPMDKAGAYGIQECGFVEKFIGSYDNVVGFPTERVAKILQELYKG